MHVDLGGHFSDPLLSFEDILNKAHEAARLAAINADAKLPPENMRGLDCGFAWVEIPDGRSPFVNHCRKMLKRHPDAGNTVADQAMRKRYGHKHWKKGWEFWCTDYHATQSISVHMAAANAFAAVLKENGIECHTGARLD